MAFANDALQPFRSQPAADHAQVRRHEAFFAQVFDFAQMLANGRRQPAFAIANVTRQAAIGLQRDLQPGCQRELRRQRADFCKHGRSSRNSALAISELQLVPRLGSKRSRQLLELVFADLVARIATSGARDGAATRNRAFGGRRRHHGFRHQADHRSTGTRTRQLLFCQAGASPQHLQFGTATALRVGHAELMRPLAQADATILACGRLHTGVVDDQVAIDPQPGAIVTAGREVPLAIGGDFERRVKLQRVVRLAGRHRRADLVGDAARLRLEARHIWPVAVRNLEFVVFVAEATSAGAFLQLFAQQPCRDGTGFAASQRHMRNRYRSSLRLGQERGQLGMVGDRRQFEFGRRVAGAAGKFAHELFAARDRPTRDFGEVARRALATQRCQPHPQIAGILCRHAKAREVTAQVRQASGRIDLGGERC